MAQNAIFVVQSSHTPLTNKMSAEVKEAFELYDEAGEGFISVKDTANVIRAFGFNPTEHELQVCLNDCLRQLKLS